MEYQKGGTKLVCTVIYIENCKHPFKNEQKNFQKLCHKSPPMCNDIEKIDCPSYFCKTGIKIEVQKGMQ